MICRSIEEIYAAADQEALDEPIRSQEWANRVALMLAGSPLRAAREHERRAEILRAHHDGRLTLGQ